MAFEFRVPHWKTYVPLIEVIAGYRRRDLGHDLVAGLVVGCITLPQAVAYAFLAGLPAAAGLYACLLPMVVYAVLGSSRELVVGPVAIAAIMVAETVRAHAPAYSDAYLGVTTVICLQAGILLWLLRATQMGGIVNLLSHPVISGFVNAAALLIIMSQLGALLGIAPIEGNPFEQAVVLAGRITDANPIAVLIGVGSFAVIWLTRRFAFYLVLPFLRRVGRQHPITRTGPIWVAIGSIAAVTVLALDTTFGVATVGFVPAGLPVLTIPPFDYALWLDLLPNSALIALVAYVESFTIGTTLAGRKHRRINSNQELIALGAANIGAAFTGAYPVAGSFSRSTVNVAAGARTPVSSLFCAAVILIALLWLTPYFAALPHAALAVIIISSLADIIDFSPIRRHWRFYHHDTYTHLVTLVTVLLFGVEIGLLVGILVAVALFVRRSSKPNLAVVGRVGTSSHFRNRDSYEVTTHPRVVAIRVDENLYFANANDVENRLTKLLLREPEAKHLVLVCSAVNFIDTSGLDMLERLNRNLSRAGVRLHLADLKDPLTAQLRASTFLDELTGSVFFTTDQAMRDLAEEG